ncbi:NHL repeat-containing protein 2 [Bulinus truncatus]|nr:NHL repeat-containing protein 2 [Bulinus truncatus]
MSSTIFDVLGIIADFEETLNMNETDCRDKILSHLKRMDKVNFQSPEFAPDLDWLNISYPLKIHDHLKGKIVVLDFFTYCCINCMHILPDLKVVEEKYTLESGLVVVGVHSAKFLNEKVTANILSAVLRFDILHPVVNDKNASLWQELAVSCWPTLVFLGPKGQLIHSIAGEGHREKVLLFLEVAMQYYSSELHPAKLPISLEKEKTFTTHLKFPGKVCYWAERNWLVITDTGNNKIVVTDVNGIIQHMIGSGQSGLKDGGFEIAEFFAPQGVACDNHNIYVADTGNHCIRKISFDLQDVKTISGTGFQGSDKKGGNTFQSQELSSPWDIVIGKTPNGSSPVLFIAMAGSHQIWVYFLSDTVWFSKSYVAGTCLCFAGTGQEENRNNSYPEKASFAQPSGLALSLKEPVEKLYIADSESSTIRYICLNDCKVSALVGGERDPTNLFAFGDTDGKGIHAKLQHPLGVAVLNDKLIVADSYNHKIKTVDLKTLMCETLAGTGHPGSMVSSGDFLKSEFSEPGGVSVNDKANTVYVADTNNHVIKVINLENNIIYKLPLSFSTEDQNEKAISATSFKVKDTLMSLPDINWTNKMDALSLSIPLSLLEDEHVNSEAPNCWEISGLDEESEIGLQHLDKSHRKGILHTFTSSTSQTSREASLKIKVPPLGFPRLLGPKDGLLKAETCIPIKGGGCQRCLSYCGFDIFEPFAAETRLQTLVGPLSRDFICPIFIYQSVRCQFYQ